MVKVELEFESKTDDVNSILQNLPDLVSKAKDIGLKLKELEVESEDQENKTHC